MRNLPLVVSLLANLILIALLGYVERHKIAVRLTPVPALPTAPVAPSRLIPTMANNGTLIGSPGFVAAGPLGQAVILNGTSQYVSIGTAFQPAAGTPWTVDFRGTVAAPDATNRVAFGSAQVGWLGFAGGVPTANVSVAANGSNVLVLTSAGGSVADGANHSVRLVVTGTTAYLFVDGAVAASAPCAYHLVTDAGVAGVPTLVGTYPTGVGTVGNNYLAGTIAELALYTTALTTAAYTPSTTPTAYNAPGLANLYRFDGDATDSASVPPAIPLTPAGVDLWDTAYPAATGSFVQSTELARLVVITDATSVSVAAYSDVYAAYPSMAAIGVRCTTPNGTVTTSSLSCTAQGANTLTAGLPGVAGTTVELIAGPQQLGGTNGRSGTYLTGATFLGGSAAVLQPPSARNRLVVLSDSIAGGGPLTGQPFAGWGDGIRATYPGSVLVDAYGGRSLRDDCATPAGVTALAQRLAGYGAARLVVCVGVNDYIGAGWSAAAFGAAYGSLLDQFHALSPATTVAAVTPLPKASEAANANGDALGAFRSAVAALAPSRPWLTVRDGSAVLTTADLGGDGVHPTAGGQAKLAAFMAALAVSLAPADPPHVLTTAPMSPGTARLPAPSDVRSGTTYGVGGNGSTGSLTVGSSGGSPHLSIGGGVSL